VVEALRAGDRFVVTSHDNPDGDALGSLLAMHLALVSLGKDSVMVLGGEQPLPGEFGFLRLEEQGLLRAAPGVGGICTALILSRFPVRNHAGRILFCFVALFGLATSIFGLATSVWVAVPALALAGASDMVSVSIRETIMQLWTPDAVRGRVNAVNSVFIGASNELGEFRAGMVAAWLGAVVAVVAGGIGTIAIAAIWSQLFPGLRQQRSLARKMVSEPGAAAAE